MKITRVYALERINFKRFEESGWEKGLLINDGERIYDQDGKVVNFIVWDYKRTSGIEVSNLVVGINDVDFDPVTGSLKIDITV